MAPLSDDILTQGAVSEDAELGPESNWPIIETNYFTIYYDESVDLEIVARRLKRRRLVTSAPYSPNSLITIEEKVAYRIDRLLKRTKEVLDMYPEMPRLKVKLFKSRNELADEYDRIFDKRVELKAFYIYKYDTIYTSEEDVSDSVIAHEMGHAVIDHYFSAIPPANIRELLASYVDLHLCEKGDYQIQQ